MPGRSSPEFWKAIGHPEAFGPCEVLWEEDDTRICRLPGAQPSFAHVLSPDGLARGRDTSDAEHYARALDRAAAAHFRWEGTGAATIRANVPAGQIVSVQVNYHGGWHATANGRAAELGGDGVGLMYVKPDCDGACEIRLVYDGGWEQRLCRWASLLTLAALVVWAVFRLRQRGMARRAVPV